MARRLEWSIDYTSENWQDVTTTAEMGALACLVFLVVFEVGRRRSRLVYWPKRRYRPHRTPRAMPSGALAWASAIAMGDEELCALVGLDAYLMLRYLRLCMRLTGFSAFWGLAVLYPLYYTGMPAGPTHGFYRCTLSNVGADSPRLWAPVALMYLYTLMGLYLIYREHELVLRLRQDWLAYGDVDTPAQARHSVVVERLPRALRSDGALRAYFELLFPGKVRARK